MRYKKGRFFALALAMSVIIASFPAAAQAAVTRAEFVSMLMEELEPETPEEWAVSQFSDVPEDAPYYDELLLARELGLVAGTGDNRFSPDTPLLKEQMYVMLYNAMDETGKLPPFETMQWVIFADWDDVSAYAENNIQTLAKLGLVVTREPEGKLYPQGTVTTEEAEKLIISAFYED